MMIKWDNVALVVSTILMIVVITILIAFNHKFIALVGEPLTPREIFAVVMLPSFVWCRVEYLNYKNNKKDN